MSKQDTINELEAIKRDLLEKIESINKTIDTLKSLSFGSAHQDVKEITLPSDIDAKYSDFKQTLPTRSKVLYIINKENRFIHTREISKILNNIERGTKSTKGNISNAVSSLRSKGKIAKHAVGSSNVNVFWGKVDWLDENNQPKPEHMYNEKELSRTIDDEI